MFFRLTMFRATYLYTLAVKHRHVRGSSERSTLQSSTHPHRFMARAALGSSHLCDDQVIWEGNSLAGQHMWKQLQWMLSCVIDQSRIRMEKIIHQSYQILLTKSSRFWFIIFFCIWIGSLTTTKRLLNVKSGYLDYILISNNNSKSILHKKNIRCVNHSSVRNSFISVDIEFE